MTCDNCKKEIPDVKENTTGKHYRRTITVQLSTKENDQASMEYCQGCWASFWDNYRKATDDERKVIDANLRAQAQKKKDLEVLHAKQ